MKVLGSPSFAAALAGACEGMEVRLVGTSLGGRGKGAAPHPGLVLWVQEQSGRGWFLSVPLKLS